MVQKAQSAYFGMPVVTRSWITLIIACAGLNQVGLVPPEALGIDASATVARFQIWRLITCASFLGGLGMQLLQKLYYLVQFGSGLERTLGLGEYARLLASCTAALCLVCNLLGWQFVGDGLIMAITVLTCQQNPNQPMSLYMITIPCSYFPFAQLCMSYLFTQQIPWQDILGALVGYLHYMINDNMKPDSIIHAREALSLQAKGSSPGGGRKLGAGKAGSSSSKQKPSTRKASGSKKKAKKPAGATCGPDGCSL